MGRHITIFGLLALLGLVCASAMAADDTVVTITVDYVDLLQVPATRALTLTATTPGEANYAEDTKTDVDGFLYSHNSTASKKITAVAVADGGNSANDITLTAQVEGQAEQTVVNAGTDVVGGAVVWTGIAAGGYTKDLIWTANGTLAGTKAGAGIDKDYIWTVTFTSADA